MIKVLGLALYGSLAASNRYRLGQYVNGLKNNDIELDIKYLLGNEYLSSKFQSNRIPYEIVIKDLIYRIKDLITQYKYDLLIIHCELIPLMPSILENILIYKPSFCSFLTLFSTSSPTDLLT